MGTTIKLNRFSTSISTALIVSSLLVLTACGGGSSGPSNSPVARGPLDTWTSMIPNVTNGRLSDIKYLNGIFLAVGSGGNGTFVAVGRDGMIISSTDAHAWTQRNSGISDDFSKVIYVDGTFIALSSREILQSGRIE